MAALVLGLLIASANTFYNSQKSDLEMLSGRVIELDSMLRDYGPDAQPIRDLLKATVTRVYQNTWNSPRSTERLATTAEIRAAWGAIGRQIDEVRPTINAQKSLQSKAADLIASIQDLRLATRLQIDNSVTWPFLSILVSWAALLFFGSGLLARLNTAAVFTLQSAHFRWRVQSSLSLSWMPLTAECSACPQPLFCRRLTLLANNQSSCIVVASLGHQGKARRRSRC